MFAGSLDRIGRLLKATLGGSSSSSSSQPHPQSSTSSDPPPGAAASAAPSASPSDEQRHAQAQAQGQSESRRGGRGERGGRQGNGRGERGGGRGGRGGGTGADRPLSARGADDGSQAQAQSEVDSGSQTERALQQQQQQQRGRGGGGRGRRGGGRGGANNANANGSASADQSAQPSSDPSQPPPTAQQSATPADAAAAASGESKHLSSRPSRKERAAAAAAKAQSRAEAAAAAAKARAEAEAALDDPSNPANQPSPALANELQALSRRYPKSFRQSQHRSSITIGWSFAPSDPDFPFELPPEHLQLEMTLHDVSQYPYRPLPPSDGSPATEAQREKLKSKISVRVLNAEKDVPAHLKRVLEGGWLYFLHTTQMGLQPQMMRNSIKMLDREITQWFILGQKQHNEKIARTISRLTGGAQSAADSTAANASSAASTAQAPASPSSSADAPAQPSTSPAPSASVAESSPPSSVPSASPAPSDSSSVNAAAQSSSTSAVAASPPAPSASPAASSSDSPDSAQADEWSPAQQAALEDALRTVPRSLPPSERWDKIAASVPGKSRKQVLARYRSLRDAVRNESSGEVAPSSSPALASSSVSVPRPPLMGREVDLEESARLHAARVREQALEREMEALRLEEEARRAEEEKSSGKGGKKQPKPARKKSDANASHSDDDQGDDEDEEEPSELAPVTERISLNPAHRGTQILAESLELKGVGIVKASTLRLQVLCVRCESRVDVEFTPANGAHNPLSDRCPRCGVSLEVAYRAEMLHEHSDSLGYMDLLNCEAFDTLPCDLSASCLECFAWAPLKSLSRGQSWDSNCRGCHARMSVRIESFVLDRITPARVQLEEGKKDSRGAKAAAAIDPREVLAAKNRKKEQSLLKLGTPLPNKGACSHLKRSYRWFRFPCCRSPAQSGKAYPCPVEHDESEDHPFAWATRMICGACSKEQPFSAHPCVHCGMSFSTQAKQFWEGGGGMRDRTRMSRNDSRKHAGLGKTVSQKAARVGSKAKEGKEKQQQKGNNTY